MLFLAVDACGTPVSHDIHTPGATPLTIQLADTDPLHALRFEPVTPSESLDTIRCEIWHELNPPTSACPDSASLANAYFPRLTQSPETLYFSWQRCGRTQAVYGTYSFATGFNAEYRLSDRTLVLHCNSTGPWVYWFGMGIHGIGPLPPPPSLVTVAATSFGPGTMRIVEDDRLEHFVGDQSTEFQVATATIS